MNSDWIHLSWTETCNDTTCNKSAYKHLLITVALNPRLMGWLSLVFHVSEQTWSFRENRTWWVKHEDDQNTKSKVLPGFVFLFSPFHGLMRSDWLYRFLSEVSSHAPMLKSFSNLMLSIWRKCLDKRSFMSAQMINCFMTHLPKVKFNDQLHPYCYLKWIVLNNYV